MTIKLFYKIDLDYLTFIYGKKIDKKKFRITILAYTLIYIGLISGFLLSSVSGNLKFYFIFSYIYVAVITYNIYVALFSRYRYTEPRYYDVIALVSFIFMPFGCLFTPIYLVVSIAWIYAGVMSLLEVQEIE
ncbi:hypothetical protein [Candidatus Acidianus copahuensis]|nr:hypothetical protein [Candidatus Acidianus copahuensis]